MLVDLKSHVTTLQVDGVYPGSNISQYEQSSILAGIIELGVHPYDSYDLQFLIEVYKS